MTSLGAKLREVREEKGLTLEEISARTKIRRSYLEAIEGDRLETIPGGFFSRSFARQYAEALGVENDIADLLEANTPVPGADVKLHRLTDYRSPNKSLILPGGSEEEGTEFYHEAAFLKDRHSNAGWMIAAALLVCLSLGYLAWTNRPEVFAALIKKDGVTKADPPSAVNATPMAEPEPAAEVAPAPPTPAPAPVVVEIKAVANTWLRVISDGQPTFDGILAAGETRTITGDEKTEMVTGNAGGLDLIYNGKPIGPVGPSGQVRRLVFTPENFEILASNRAPRKPAPPSAEGVAPGQ
jgi:cytoskeleton protein RodZ